MSTDESLDVKSMKDIFIRVHEPLAEFLHGSPEEVDFSLTLLDVVRFSGHACPSVVGAFLIAKRAIETLYPAPHIGVRGDLSVQMPLGPSTGASGPMANVLGYIVGAWAETGFGGLKGRFSRRGLLSFGCETSTCGGIRFTRVSTGESVVVFYDSSLARVAIDPKQSFQDQWRAKIAAILRDPTVCVRVERDDGVAIRET